MGVFHVFLNCAIGMKSRQASHISVKQETILEIKITQSKHTLNTDGYITWEDLLDALIKSSCVTSETIHWEIKREKLSHCKKKFPLEF